MNRPEGPEEQFTLEQILAEYKSEAFIRNERRMPKEELERQAAQIIADLRRESEGLPSLADTRPMTAAGETPSSGAEAEPGEDEHELARRWAQAMESQPEIPPLPRREPEVPQTPRREPEPEPQEEPAPEPVQKPVPEAVPGPVSKPLNGAGEGTGSRWEELSTGPEPEETAADGPREPVPEQGDPAAPAPEAAAASAAELEALRLAEEAAREEERARQAREKRQQQLEREQQKQQRAQEKQEQRRRQEEVREERDRLRAERLEEARKRRSEELAAREEARRQQRQEWLRRMADISPAEATERYASGITFLRRRTAAAFLLCVPLALITLLGGSGSALPRFMQGPFALCLALLVLQCLVMLCAGDVIVRGLSKLVTGKMDGESLAAIANIAALGDALWIMLGSETPVGLPYSAPAALILAFALWGSRMQRTALRDTFRTMTLAQIPTVVNADPDLLDVGPAVTKRLGSYRGFIAAALQRDPVRDLYRRLSPLLLGACVLLTLAAWFATGDAAWIHVFTVLSCAAATSTALISYARPFMKTAARLAGKGAALAGWSGAEELGGAAGVILRDQDVFPDKAINLAGMKVLSGTKVDRVISYTGSMILTSDSGLKRTFSELMRQYAAPMRRTEDFRYDTEGGISAMIGQDQVDVGCAAYMTLKGIRIPEDIVVPGAVYTAVDQKLCAVFIVEYTPADSIRSAILSLRGSRLRPVYAIRDFNVSLAMLQSKFRLRSGELVFPSQRERYRLSASQPGEEGPPPAAILSRETVGHYLDTIRSGRRLRRAVRRSLGMSLLGTVLSMGIGALAAIRGAYASISPWNMLLFLFFWALSAILFSDNADGA